ncbi:serine/threonine protein phosphatase [Flavobacterium arcticum]|uniref:Serine/threonine protein phosphatase n=1 Tax=Flavobacterium arcticum TaxID=1784713 RepID=A0A345HBD7_9FLAO|nr:metallophosphoesterase family protein [Flavobacterium arcticum]AXG73897.1 serine/threonine protein phosphatase [Flavobacterium arcticum]KAF2508873.1 serine/threonine protein phosphatase [Flavobacterium arcticum]
MSRTLVIGDIHGAYIALQQILERATVTTSDTLIFLGDYVDGWSQSAEVIDFLMEIKQQYNSIFMRGNHDDLLLDWMKTGEYNEQWFNHGGKLTTEKYSSVIGDRREAHVAFLENLQDYHHDNDNKLFLHAGFTNQNGIKGEYFTRMFYWDRTLWETALALDESLEKNHPQYPKRFTHYSEIFIGHTPVTRIGETKPVNKASIWNVDTGAAFKGPLTVIDADTKEYWQSDPVYKLYPNEDGRN